MTTIELCPAVAVNIDLFNIRTTYPCSGFNDNLLANSIGTFDLLIRTVRGDPGGYIVSPFNMSPNGLYVNFVSMETDPDVFRLIVAPNSIRNAIQLPTSILKMVIIVC